MTIWLAISVLGIFITAWVMALENYPPLDTKDLLFNTAVSASVALIIGTFLVSIGVVTSFLCTTKTQETYNIPAQYLRISENQNIQYYDKEGVLQIKLDITIKNITIENGEKKTAIFTIEKVPPNFFFSGKTKEYVEIVY